MVLFENKQTVQEVNYFSGIWCCRPTWEGAHHNGGEHELQVIRLARNLGVDFIEFDLKVLS